MRFFPLFILAACSRDDLYAETSFTDNVAEAFADCNPSEIRFLAGKHAIQTAFRNCGSNTFGDVSWSPDGVRLHFRVVNGSYLLNAEDKTITTVPTEVPTADSAWLHKELIAMPLQPAEGETLPRLVQYNLSANTIDISPLPVNNPQDLQTWGDGESLLMLATGEDGTQRPYRFNPADDSIGRAFDFIDVAVERISYAPDAGLLAWSTTESTELMRDDGTSLKIFSGVKRAIPHPEGRYVALEVTGEGISPFDQRAWGELSPEARKRELARQEQFIERLPEWAPREYNPPEIQIYDIEKELLYRVTAFYGDHFEWYQTPNPLSRYYGSFILWGIEGKQLNRNVGLTDLSEKLRMLDKGDIPLGIEAVEDSEPKPGGQDTEDVSTETPTTPQ
ncbi:MAG: hypothetical protein P8R54_18655 [Myxococcota bacterium]|nr:hypothetical protein [Myxococcota bacterium]